MSAPHPPAVLLPSALGTVRDLLVGLRDSGLPPGPGLLEALTTLERLLPIAEGITAELLAMDVERTQLIASLVDGPPTGPSIEQLALLQGRQRWADPGPVAALGKLIQGARMARAALAEMTL